MLVRSQIHLQVTRSASVLLLAIHPKHKLRMCADQLAANLYFLGCHQVFFHSSILPAPVRVLLWLGSSCLGSWICLFMIFLSSIDFNVFLHCLTKGEHIALVTVVFSSCNALRYLAHYHIPRNLCCTSSFLAPMQLVVLHANELT